jgi:hypothetical protein
MTKKPRAQKPAPRTVGLYDAIEEAFSEIESLAEEMRSWADGMPESLQGGDKYSAVDEAASSLENASRPDEPGDELDGITVTIQDPTPRRRGYSRADRLGQAVYILDACISALEDFAASEDPEFPEEKAEAADAYKDEIENAKSEVESVEFPGMYG